MKLLLVFSLLLGAGALVAFFLLSRPPIKIFEENLNQMEKQKLLQQLKAPEEVQKEAQGELTKETILTITRLMGIPFIQTRINDQPYLLQLDFGSRYTSLSPDIALELQLPIISEEFQEKGPGGEYGFYFARVKEIRLGEAKVLHDLVAIQMRRISAKLFGLLKVFDYQGVIGAQTLKHFVITLNLAKKQFILHAKGHLQPSGVAVPFTSVSDLILVHGLLNGQGPFNLLLDPGAPVLVLAPRAAHQLGLGLEVKGRSSLEVQLEGLPTMRQPVFVARSLEEARTDMIALDGLLGRSFLERWVVTIDFERQLLYFEEP